jgi:nitrogen fixation-related uncharacterized protein
MGMKRFAVDFAICIFAVGTLALLWQVLTNLPGS